MRIRWDSAVRSFSVGLATRKYTGGSVIIAVVIIRLSPSHTDGLPDCSLGEARMLEIEWNKSSFPCVTQAVI